MKEMNKTSKEMFDNRFKINWVYILIGMAAFIPTLVLFIVNASTNLDSKVLGWVMFAIFVPFILWALFMAQKKDLVGSYGETILLLIPTFVWLLPGHDHAIWVMIIIAFTLILIGSVLYVIARVGSVISKSHAENRWRTLTPILIRLAFVAMSVVATLIVSIILINWGDHSLKLAPLSADGSGETNYTDSVWIVYVAVVTILVALMLVLLGLASQFNFHFTRQNNKTVKEAILSSNDNKTKIKSDFLNKTIEFKKDRKKKRK